MKKLCESSLGKIEISNVGMGKKWYEKIGEELKDKVYSVGATTSGFITSVANNVAGTDLSNLYLFEGYEKAYYGGAIGGDIASGIIGLAETIIGPIMAGMGIVTTGGGILVSSTGIGTAPGMAVSEVGVAITTVGVAATVQGVGIIGNSGNNLSDDIQNFKDSGTSGIKLPSKDKVTKEEKMEEFNNSYHTLVIDEKKTYKNRRNSYPYRSKDTPVYLHILFAVLMGIQKSEINGIKYTDIDYMHRKLYVQRQLGKKKGLKKEDVAVKTFTKQEVQSKSSNRVLDIPDLVFEAILEERKKYEARKHRRKNDKTNPFQDLGFVCCSTYGRPRSRGFIFQHF